MTMNQTHTQLTGNNNNQYAQRIAIDGNSNSSTFLGDVFPNIAKRGFRILTNVSLVLFVILAGCFSKDTLSQDTCYSGLIQ